MIRRALFEQLKNANGIQFIPDDHPFINSILITPLLYLNKMSVTTTFQVPKKHNYVDMLYGTGENLKVSTLSLTYEAFDDFINNIKKIIGNKGIILVNNANINSAIGNIGGYLSQL